ncbi:MAG: hypothetical protein JWM35_1888 [Verrucomicrobia bacterium]|nr:hypothetical protein [Verrucomicrobiota bacterium]
MSSEPEAAEARIEHEAAAWLARRDRGLSATEQDEFFSWLAADPRHGEWLGKHQETVRGLKMLAQWRPEHGARPNPDLLAGPATRAGTTKAKKIFWALPLGLAAAIAILFFAVRTTKEAMPDVAAQTPLIMRKILEDGSSIDLNHGAVVEVNYTPGERSIRLVKGEANFTVAKNTERPFIVDAAGVKVRAVGTAFNVNLMAKAVEVFVTEGKVQVSQAGAKSVSTADSAPMIPILEAGHRATVSLEPSVPKIESVPVQEVKRLLAWQPRQLEFNDTPLAQVVAEFNGTNKVKMVVDDPGLASVPVGASLRSDNVEGFVRLLEASFGVKADRRTDGVIVLRRAN